jgi:hypothetical protein
VVVAEEELELPLGPTNNIAGSLVPVASLTPDDPATAGC